MERKSFKIIYETEGKEVKLTAFFILRLLNKLGLFRVLKPGERKDWDYLKPQLTFVEIEIDATV